MKKVNLIYLTTSEPQMRKLLKTGLFPTNIRLNYFDKKVSCLYGWSSDDEVVKHFLFLHKKPLFSLVKKKVSETEMDQLVSEYPSLEINYNNFRSEYDETQTILIPSTYEEKNIVIYNYSEYKFEILKRCVSTDFRIFKRKYIDALILLGYCEEHVLHEDDEFGMAKEFRSPIPFKENEMGMYSILYADLLDLEEKI